MSFNLQKPKLTRPGTPPAPMTRPAPPTTGASKLDLKRPTKAAPAVEAEIDPFADFESELPTSGVPAEQAAEMGLVGSQVYGEPPDTQGQQGEETEDLEDFFGDDGAESITVEPLAATEAEADEGDGEDDDFGDDDPFASDDETPEVASEGGNGLTTNLQPPLNIQRPGYLQKPSTGQIQMTPAKAPAGKKGYQVLQENGSIIFDTKLIMGLSSVSEARVAWDTLYKPFEDMTEEEKYTRNRAGEILVRDREERLKAAKLLADALATDDDLPEQEGEIVATLTLGKDEAQAGTPDLGTKMPPAIAARLRQSNTLMERCHNRAAGCTSMKLNHQSGTGKCFFPDCSCQGRCESFVSKEEMQAHQEPGGNSPQEGTKSTLAQPNQAPQSSAPASGSAQGAAEGQLQGTPSGAGTTGGEGGNRAPDGSHPQQAQQAQDGASASVGQAGTSPGQTSAKTDAGAGSGVERPASQAGSEGSEEEPLITGDLLSAIVMKGGRGPGHSDYFPQPGTDPDDNAVRRRHYISHRFVQFWENATQKEVQAGQGKARVLNTDEFDFKSTSYRVVLAAQKVSQAIEMFVSAPKEIGYQAEPKDQKGLSPTDNQIIQNHVGPAAVAYVEAHKPLSADKLDGTWDEYLEYLDAFKDTGLKMGMLLHEFQAQQQAQAST